MNISDRTIAQQIIAAINATGAKAPKAIADTYEETVRVSTAAGNLGAGTTALAPAIAAALIDGHDPATDPEVQRILIASQIGNEGVHRMVEAIAYDRFRAVCLEHGNELVSAWRKPFDQAAKQLVPCFDQIGAVPLEDTHAIMQRGGDVAEVWAQAQNASHTIEAINSGWTALAQLTRTVQINPDFRVLQMSAVDYRTWTARDLRRKNLKPWEFLLNDLALSLPTAAEYRARVQKITDGMAQIETVVDPQRSMVAGREIRVPA